MRIAAVTMAYNERLFLPIWLDYYGTQLGYENLFVIDDNSDDGSTADFRIVNPIRKAKAPFDEEIRASLASFFHEELLSNYEAVIFTDTDEIIVVEPRLGVGLADYIARANRQWATTIGFDVLYRTASETALDLDRPLFVQRGYVRFSENYCKSLISRLPIRWGPGFHMCNYHPAFDTNLYLFHLRAIDPEYSLQRIRALNKLQFSDDSLRNRYGYHWLWSERKYMDHLYGTSEPEFDLAYDGEPVDIFRKGRASVGTDLARIPPRFGDSISLSRLTTPAGAKPELREAMSTVRRPVTSDALAKMFQRAMDRAITTAPGRNRNEGCPCGSGKRFKHCHGRRA